MANVTVLGLGAMGARMARRLLDAGFDVTVWNRSPASAAALAARGATVAASPREAVAQADVALAMVRDDDASRDEVVDHAPFGVDTQADLERARRTLAP